MSMLDFTAPEKPIRIDRGATWDHVWTFPHDNPLVGDFEFIVTKDDGTVVEATCTITDDVAGKVRIVLDDTDFDTYGNTRYVCKQTVSSVVRIWFKGELQTA